MSAVHSPISLRVIKRVALPIARFALTGNLALVTETTARLSPVGTTQVHLCNKGSIYGI